MSDRYAGLLGSTLSPPSEYLRAIHETQLRIEAMVERAVLVQVPGTADSEMRLFEVRPHRPAPDKSKAPAKKRRPRKAS